MSSREAPLPAAARRRPSHPRRPASAQDDVSGRALEPLDEATARSASTTIGELLPDGQIVVPHWAHLEQLPITA
jgi:hypothetical protein